MPRDMLITGGQNNFIQGNQIINPTGHAEIDAALDRLYSRSAPSAYHNSSERIKRVSQQVMEVQPLFSSPIPGEETDAERSLTNIPYPPRGRQLYEALKLDVETWIRYDSTPIMWVHGESEPSNSLVAQSLAEFAQHQGYLSSAFFFTKSSSSSTCKNRGAHVVPTMAYQVAQSIPETRDIIARTVRREFSLFDMPFERQIRKLIVDPLIKASHLIQDWERATSNLFIVHGLDKCDDESFQVSFLHAWVDALAALPQNLQHKLLIVGRNKAHLSRCFGQHGMRERVIKRKLEDPFLDGTGRILAVGSIAAAATIVLI